MLLKVRIGRDGVQPLRRVRLPDLTQRARQTCRLGGIAQTLAVELYLEAGIRGVEIGSILADRDPDTHENRYPRLELLRLAIPRRVYSDNHIRVIAAACRNIYERRAEITTGYRITFEAPILRHFTVELDKI